jgi:hypothetical protein
MWTHCDTCLPFSLPGAFLAPNLATILRSQTNLPRATRATDTCSLPNHWSSMLAFRSAPDAGEPKTLHHHRGPKHLFTAAEPRTDPSGCYLKCKCDHHDYKYSQWMHKNWPCNEDGHSEFQLNTMETYTKEHKCVSTVVCISIPFVSNTAQ